MESYTEQDHRATWAIFGRDEEEEVEETNQTTLGAVGATVLVATACCRGILVTILTEKWRVHVFFVLNLLLLSIFFTSRRCHNGGNQQWNVNLEVEIEEEEEKKEEMVVDEEPRECDRLDVEKVAISEEGINGQEDDAPKVMCEGPKLSKDELNRRVEAFIYMFRQQLILDARNGGIPQQTFRSTHENGSSLTMKS